MCSIATRHRRRALAFIAANADSQQDARHRRIRSGAHRVEAMGDRRGVEAIW